jgi:hypothetical protein
LDTNFLRERRLDRQRTEVELVGVGVSGARKHVQAAARIERGSRKRLEATDMSHELDEFMRCERMQHLASTLQRRCPCPGPHDEDSVWREQAPRFP